MKIKISEILEVSERYINICKNGGYYNRRNNFSKIYDHFFVKLYKKIINNKQKNLGNILNYNIEKCSNDNYEVIETTKANHNFSKRKVIIPNFYDVLYYEILLQKIINQISITFKSNTDLSNYLIDNKYIGYAHRVNYNSDKLLYEHYFNGWNSYNKIKQNLLNDNIFYIESDIKGFYDNINHDNLIYYIKKIIESNNIRINIKEFNNILLNLNNVLFKVSGFRKEGIPQGLISSDILSQLYLWLILYFETLKPERIITFKDGVFKMENGNVKIITYSDDIMLFSSSEKYLFKGFSHLNNILEMNNLNINFNKTTIITKTEDFSKGFEININEVKKNNIIEIIKVFDTLNSILSNPFIKLDIGNLKTIFKFFYKISILNKIKKKEIIKTLIKNINFNKGDIENNKKISLLIIISPDNFALFLKEILLVNDKIEELFINKYLKDYELYISILHLIF